jgi:hypothetical protein
VEFAITIPEISYETDGEYITVRADSGDMKSEISHMDFRKAGVDVASLVKFEFLSEEEKKSGIIKRKIPDGAENFKIYFKNEYGIWTHKIIHIDRR